MATPDLESVITGALQAATADESDTGGGGEINTSLEDTNTETDGSGAAESTDTPNLESQTTGDAAAATEGTEPPPVEPEDPFAKEHGITPKRKDGKVNYLPYPRVKSIAANAEKKTFEKVTGVKLADGETIDVALPKFHESIRERDEKISALETEFKSMSAVEQIIETDAERFLAMAASINPQFGQILQHWQGKNGQPTGKTAVPAGDDPEPQPDIDLGDGKVTYSLDGLRKLREWDRRQAKRELQSDIDATLGPIKHEREVATRIGQARDALQSYVDGARTNWTGFKDWEPEILAEIPKTDARMAPSNRLFMAYLRVRDAKHKAEVERLTTDHNKVRARVVEEMSKRTTSTATTGGAAVVRSEEDSAEAKADPVGHAIKQSIRKAGLR